MVQILGSWLEQMSQPTEVWLWCPTVHDPYSLAMCIKVLPTTRRCSHYMVRPPFRARKYWLLPAGCFSCHKSLQGAQWHRWVLKGFVQLGYQLPSGARHEASGWTWPTVRCSGHSQHHFTHKRKLIYRIIDWEGEYQSVILFMKSGHWCHSNVALDHLFKPVIIAV